jgi:hypothetical protein
MLDKKYTFRVVGVKSFYKVSVRAKSQQDAQVQARYELGERVRKKGLPAVAWEAWKLVPIIARRTY